MNQRDLQDLANAAFERGYSQAVEEVTLAPGLALWAGLAFGFALGVIVMAFFAI